MWIPHIETRSCNIEVSWKPQDVWDARAVGYLVRKAANREWNYPRRNKDEKGVGDLKTALTSATKIQSLEFAYLVSCLVLRITVK